MIDIPVADTTSIQPCTNPVNASANTWVLRNSEHPIFHQDNFDTVSLEYTDNAICVRRMFRDGDYLESRSGQLGFERTQYHSNQPAIQQCTLDTD